MIERSNLRPGDRAVFLCLLRRADNETCEMLPRFTPSLESISAKTGLHISSVKRSLAHLEKHGWLYRDRSKGGAKRRDGAHHRTVYHLFAIDVPVRCECFVHARNAPYKQAHSEPVSASKQAHSEPQNRRIDPDVSAGQTPNCTEGLRDRGNEGRDQPERESDRREGGALTESLAHSGPLPDSQTWREFARRSYDQERLQEGTAMTAEVQPASPLGSQVPAGSTLPPDGKPIANAKQDGTNLLRVVRCTVQNRYKNPCTGEGCRE